MRRLEGRLDLCSINTATLGHQADIHAMTEAVARAGYGFVCPWRRDLEDQDVRIVARHIRDSGLKVSGFCRSTYIPAASRTEFLANIDDNRYAIDQAVELEADCFVMVVGSLPAGSKDLLRARDQLAEGTAMMLNHAKSLGARLALEPLHPMYANDRSCLNTLEQALDLAEEIELDAGDRPSLGVAIDLYHVWWDPKFDEQTLRAGNQNRILGFHVCDWLVPTRDFLTDRGMMGDGVIDIPPYRRKVEEAGYDGAVEVEIFSALDWWKRPIEEILAVCSERLQTLC